MKKSTTRNALVTSLLSLLLCASMLLGTTFAWFTDSVTSTGNIIKSGTLDVEMSWAEDYTGDTTTWKNASEGAIFDYKFWEPGFTQTRYVKIENKGDLAFKYQLSIVPAVIPAAGQPNLADVIEAYLVPLTGAPTDRADADAIIASGNGATLTELIADPDGAAHGIMLPADGKGATDTITIPDADKGSAIYCIVLHMQESAGNEYQNLSVGDGFSVHLLASQLAYEKDSFDEKYDTEAIYDAALPAAGSVEIVEGQTSYTVYIKSVLDKTDSTTQKVATALVNAESVIPGTEQVTFVIKEGTAHSNITLTANQMAQGYDITATGLKADNQNEVQFKLYVGEGLTGVKLYHYDEEITNAAYADGWVTFWTKTFSPFTLVFDAVAQPDDDTHEPGDTPNDLPAGMPRATVTDADQYENVPMNWGNYGAWSPDAGEENKALESAYTFTAPHDSSNIDACQFKDWYCDFYVMLDRALPAESIFLGGYYESFNAWVAFDNADITLAANEALPLLGSVTQNPWTYELIATGVHEFVCGVARKGDALEGATFTVMLRLTNPEDENEFYNVNTVEYTFEPMVEAGSTDALEDAIAAGGNEVTVHLTDGSFTIPTTVAGKDVTMVGNGEDTVVDFTGAANVGGADITFKNMKFQGKNENVMNGFGIQGTTGKIVYQNCTFDGAVTNEYFGSVEYIDCTFTGTGYITTYAVDSAKFVGCTFDKADTRNILVYSHGDNPVEVTVEDCTFTAAGEGETWQGHVTAAIEVDTTNIPSAGTSVTVEGCTYGAHYNGLVRDKSTAGKETAVITVDGTVVDNTTIKTTGYAL